MDGVLTCPPMATAGASLMNAARVQVGILGLLAAHAPGCKDELALGEQQINAGLKAQPKAPPAPKTKGPGCEWRGPTADHFFHRGVGAVDDLDVVHQLWFGAGSWEVLAQRVIAQPARSVEVFRDGELRFSLSFDEKGRPLRRTEPSGWYIEASYVDDRLTQEVSQTPEGAEGYWATYTSTPDQHCVKHDLEGWQRETWRDDSSLYARETKGGAVERSRFEDNRLSIDGTTWVYDDKGRVQDVGGILQRTFSYGAQATTVAMKSGDAWIETIELDPNGLPTRWSAKDRTWTYVWK